MRLPPLRPLRVAFVAVIGILLSSAATAAAAADPAPRPNVLLILSDDHSGPDVGCYGNRDIRTPHLDRLAAEGMRFDRAYVTCPQCVPSRASILTGRHPVDIGMTRFSAALPNDVPIFPQALRADGGYHTGIAGRSYHLSGTRIVDHPAVRPHLTEADVPNFEPRVDFLRVASEEGGNAARTAETLRQFDEFLSLVPQGKPFFLWLNFADPHRPLTDEDLPHRHDPAQITLPPDYPDTPGVRRDLAAYYDEIGRLDAGIGRLLATLDQRGLTKNTIVLFMGDNGASQLRGKGTLNERGIRVPLIIRWPGVTKPGSACDALVSGEDLAPTLLQAAGLTPDASVTGLSFLPLLKDPAAKPARTFVVSERGPHASGLPRGSNSFDLGRSLVTGRHKLIYNALWQLPYQPVDFNLKELEALRGAGQLDERWTTLYLAPTRPMFELYDLEKDPHELNNLAGKPAARDVEQQLKGQLSAWMIQHRDFLPLPLTPAAKK